MKKAAFYKTAFGLFLCSGPYFPVCNSLIISIIGMMLSQGLETGRFSILLYGVGLYFFFRIIGEFGVSVEADIVWQDCHLNLSE